MEVIEHQKLIRTALHRFDFTTILSAIQNLDAGFWDGREAISALVEAAKTTGKAPILKALKEALRKQAQTITSQIEEVNDLLGEESEPARTAVVLAEGGNGDIISVLITDELSEEEQYRIRDLAQYYWQTVNFVGGTSCSSGESILKAIAELNPADPDSPYHEDQ